VAEHVVRGAALAIGENTVCLVQLLEARLGAVVLVDVGMVLLRETPKGALDLGVIGLAPDAEDVVVVTLHGHGGQDHTNWHSLVASASLWRRPAVVHDVCKTPAHPSGWPAGRLPFLPPFVRNQRLRSAR
jgi:hypothetical protein